MYIGELDWDDNRIDHIAQHDVDLNEVWDACEDPQHMARRQGRNRYLLYGRTGDGRYLFVVLEQVKDSVYKPITARDMTNGEKSKLRGLRK